VSRSVSRDRIATIALAVLLAATIGRLWLMPLPSSFWVDEMATVFVVQHGASHPSLAAAPQVPDSIYYYLPAAAQRLLGSSEIAYRLPSLLLMGLALFLIARLAARLIAPEAAWFAIFACLSMRGFNDQAADARPYALGTCLVAACLLFLIRWMDEGRWFDGVLFVITASLVWRVHLLFWPFYIVIALYAAVRLIRKDSRPGWLLTLAAFVLIGLALVPVLADALHQFRRAEEHVIVALPTGRDLRISLKLGLILISGLGAFGLSRVFRWPRTHPSPPGTALFLVAGWWLIQPMALFAASYLTGSSMFVTRYLYIALPGAALAATLAVAYFMAADRWAPLTIAFAAGVLAMLGQWREPWPVHQGSNWRLAARTIDQWDQQNPDTPVLCPSPFIEARPPVWQPSYQLPGFLYCHLPVYPFRGKPYLLPFDDSPEAERYVQSLAAGPIPASGRFLIYGFAPSAGYWRDWFLKRPEFASWQSRSLGSFGNVVVELFERPAVEPKVHATLSRPPV
jgi:hypothetical protein